VARTRYQLIEDDRHAVDETEAVMYQNLSMGLRFKLTMGRAVLTPVLIVSADILETSISEVEGDR